MLLRRSFSITRAVASAAQTARAAPTARALSTIVHKSPHPDLNVTDRSIFDLISDRVPHYAKRTALICGLSHETVTYEDMFESSKRIAAGLASDGVKKGDVVLLHSLNCLEYPSVLLALYALGAVCSPVSTLLTPNEVARQARFSSAKRIISHRALEKVAIEAADIAGMHKSRIYTVGSSSEPRHLKSINELMERDFESFSFKINDPYQRAYLPFSSGTTGLPKGVALSVQNLACSMINMDYIEKCDGNMIAVLPWFHIYPVTMLHLSMYQGAANVVLPRFEIESFLDTLTRYKVEKAVVNPSVALVLAHHPLVDKYDLSSTKYLVSAGATMGKEVEMLLHERLGVRVKQAYGMTELSAPVTYTEDTCMKLGSVGRLVPTSELRVQCLQTRRDLPSNQQGELLIGGPQNMIGYHENEEATQKTITPDGFIRTGDLGYIDQDGFVFVVDRVKELIKYGNDQVAPAELEDILNRHPKIADACAVRGFGELGEELPKAYVVRKDASLTEEEVMAFVASKVAPFKQVRQVEFIRSIPKSPTGKILRRELQDLEDGRRKEALPAAA